MEFLQASSLTASTEVKTGGAGDDTFLALNNGDLGNSDQVIGGDGNDTLYAVINTGDGSAVSLGRPVIKQVENLEIELVEVAAGTTAGDTNILKLDKSSGITSVNLQNYTFASNADTTVITDVTTATTLTITDDAGHATARANNFTMTYDGVSGTADSASVIINSTASAATLANITVAGVEDLTFSSTGGAGATYNVVGADATKLTLNASALSGGTVDLAAAKVATLDVNAADSVTVTDAGGASAKLRTVNIDSQTAAKTVTLTDLTPTMTSTAQDLVAEAFTVNVQGAGKAVITAEDTQFGTQSDTNADSFVVAAGSNTGGVTVSVASMTTAAARVISVTGGTGDDTVIVAKGALDQYDTIALGDGTGDKLSVTATYATNAAEDLFYNSDDSDATNDPTISGVEIASVTLSDSGAASTVDASSAAFADTLELLGDTENASATINDIAVGQTVKLGSTLDLTDASSALILNVKGATSSAPAASLSIKSDLLETSTDGNIDDLRVDAVLAVDIDLASADADLVTVTVDGASFDKATSVTVSSAENVTFGGIDAADDAVLDFTAVTGTVGVTVDTTNDYTVKGSATKATTFVMSTGLDADDVIEGGAATTDSLSATVTSLTATTGALKVSGVETLTLTNSGTAVVDFTAVTGATNVALAGGATATTLSKLKAGTAVTLGAGTTAHTGALTVALADATGTADSLTLNLTGAGTEGLNTITTAGIETLNIVGAATMDTQNLSVLAVDASTIVVTGGNTTSAVDLELTGGSTMGTASTVKLNANTSVVDASGYNGVISAIAATNTAVTMSSKVAGSLLTGGALADTFNVGSTASYVTGDVAIINAGSGSDVLNVYVKNAADLDEITDVETINIYMDPSDTDGFSMVGVTSSDGIDAATTVTVNGGLADQQYAITGSITDTGAKLIDASGLLGSVSLTFAEDAAIVTNAADMITITGGQSATDVVTIELDGATAGKNTGLITMSGVEKLVVQSHTTNANTLDMKNISGVTTITVSDGAETGTELNVDNAVSGLTFIGGTTGTDEFTQVIDVNLADATGTADEVTLQLKNVTGSSSGIDATGIETVNLVATAAAATSTTITTNVTGTTTNGTVNVSGADADDEVTLASISSGYTTVSATGLKGDLSIAASARGSDAMNITGGDGADTIAMENKADVLDGGAGVDNLVVSTSGTGGALIVDLSSTTDQIQMLNGLANSEVQKGFESVDASSYIQTNSVGADITGSSAANVIKGTGYADTIRGGAGNDTIDGNAGADQIYVGAGVDTVDLDAADTTTGALTLGTTVISGSADIIYGMGDTDKIDLGLTMTAATSVALGTAVINAAGAAADQVTLVRGSYADGIFTAGTNASDDDYLVQGNDHSASDVVFSAVLIDVVGTVTYDISTAGIMELNVA